MDDILRGNNSGHIVILHFNINVSLKTNVTFCNYMNVSHNCDQLVKGCTTKYQPTIDLVFSNYKYQEVSTINSYLYDHYMVYTVIDNSDIK